MFLVASVTVSVSQHSSSWGLLLAVHCITTAADQTSIVVVMSVVGRISTNTRVTTLLLHVVIVLITT